MKACTLTPTQHVVQRKRYERVRSAVESVEREPTSLVVRFGAAVDDTVLEKLVSVERDCCAFLTIDFEPPVLRMSSDDPRDLDPFERALR